MPRTACTTALLLLAGLAVGCAAPAPPPPVTVVGAADDLSSMAGDWRGEYWSAATGRQGTIEFALQAGTGAAWGEVWMFPAQPHARDVDADHGRDHRGGEALQIRFVRIAAGGAVSGSIDPYPDPECDCLLTTTFVGELDGDRIQGTYTTHGGLAHGVAKGEWEVRRSTEGDAP